MTVAELILALHELPQDRIIPTEAPSETVSAEPSK